MKSYPRTQRYLRLTSRYLKEVPFEDVPYHKYYYSIVQSTRMLMMVVSMKCLCGSSP